MLTHWIYVFLALTHRYVACPPCSRARSLKHFIFIMELPTHNNALFLLKRGTCVKRSSVISQADHSTFIPIFHMLRVRPVCGHLICQLRTTKSNVTHTANGIIQPTACIWPSTTYKMWKYFQPLYIMTVSCWTHSTKYLMSHVGFVTTSTSNKNRCIDGFVVVNNVIFQKDRAKETNHCVDTLETRLLYLPTKLTAWICNLLPVEIPISPWYFRNAAKDYTTQLPRYLFSRIAVAFALCDQPCARLKNIGSYIWEYQKIICLQPYVVRSNSGIHRDVTGSGNVLDIWFFSYIIIISIILIGINSNRRWCSTVSIIYTQYHQIDGFVQERYKSNAQFIGTAIHMKGNSAPSLQISKDGMSTSINILGKDAVLYIVWFLSCITVLGINCIKDISAHIDTLHEMRAWNFSIGLRRRATCLIPVVIKVNLISIKQYSRNLIKIQCWNPYVEIDLSQILLYLNTQFSPLSKHLNRKTALRQST